MRIYFVVFSNVVSLTLLLITKYMVVETYHDVNNAELTTGLYLLNPQLVINSEDAFYSEDKILELTYTDETDDAIFGYMTRLTYINFLILQKLKNLEEK